MTWFQLADSLNSESEPRQPTRLVPNSALFLNPTLLQPAGKPESSDSRPRLRLIKGSRVDSAAA